MAHPAHADELLAVAVAALGPCTVVADRSWPYGEARVLELALADGRRVIAKGHRQAAKFTGEVEAYRRWVPALGDRAPTVVAVDETTQTLVLQRLPGEPAPRHVPDVHRQAGELLARFHAAEAPVVLVGHAEAQRQRLAEWAGRDHQGAASSALVRFVERRLDVLAELPDPFGVPCHRDWQPRNWLLADDGTVAAIDFEHARVQPAWSDLHRLRWDEWHDAPHLRAAFFDGYGRTLDDAEVASLEAESALGHLVTVIWSRQHGDDAYEAFARRCLAELGAPGA